MKTILLATAFLGGLFTVPRVVDDCHVTGPIIVRAGADAPLVFDNGSDAIPNAEGCDGCTFDFEVMVVWQHFGHAVIVLPDYSIIHGFVKFNDFDVAVCTVSVGCGEHATIDIVSEEGGAYVRYNCSACQ